MSCSTKTRIEGVPHYDIEVNNHNLDNVAKMLIEHIKKDWDVNTLCRKDFTDGITNKLVGYYMKTNTKNTSRFAEYGRTDIVLVRVYGERTELIINRAQELRNIEELSRNHIAPPLYATFSNGYCYRFIEGRVLSPEDFTNKDILKLSAEYLAKIHTAKLSESYMKHHKMESNVFATIKEYINLMPKKFNNPAKNERYEKEVPSVTKLHAEVDTLVHAVSNLNNLAVTFCHNDFLIANFIVDEYEGKLHCIDHEYGCPNYSTYDIGNHFNEFCGVDTVDYSLYPSKETQLEYLKIYLEKINEFTGVKTPVTEEKINESFIHVEHMSLVSHLFWGVWAMIQAFHSQIDFDFLDYGIVRLNEYHRRKEEVLAKYMNELIL